MRVMTDEEYNKATLLRKRIEDTKKALDYWKKAVGITESDITLDFATGYNGQVKTAILKFISFDELKGIAIQRLSDALKGYQEEYASL